VEALDLPLEAQLLPGDRGRKAVGARRLLVGAPRREPVEPIRGAVEARALAGEARRQPAAVAGDLPGLVDQLAAAEVQIAQLDAPGAREQRGAQLLVGRQDGLVLASQPVRLDLRRCDRRTQRRAERATKRRLQRIARHHRAAGEDLGAEERAGGGRQPEEQGAGGERADQQEDLEVVPPSQQRGPHASARDCKRRAWRRARSSGAEVAGGSAGGGGGAADAVLAETWNRRGAR
jgi:hypothetical protein